LQQPVGGQEEEEGEDERFRRCRKMLAGLHYWPLWPVKHFPAVDTAPVLCITIMRTVNIHKMSVMILILRTAFFHCGSGMSIRYQYKLEDLQMTEKNLSFFEKEGFKFNPNQ
jgi:hypothetical protein